ncbi:MAG: adhesin [Methanobrevibacter thaueri]|jgi:parallel beta-helix repeat protein|uniref:right-handed parallel beta-helix repeat-containing protein n=1 Tax=Methanobrevibacter thaueri TaxID=190975 RepID=UPI0026EAD9F8|nr:right-handed parallel beta-helix repeat-containing protein [Methanobrevibacter thaueri]MBE6494968.1 adhesin [Methanobrevibacter thaueri]
MNKRFSSILFICLIGLFLVTAVSAAEENQTDNTLAGVNYQITSDLSNEDIQGMLDGASDGDTFEFTDKTYNNVSLVVDKKLNIISKTNSKVYTSSQLNTKAKSLGITDTFGFYFTSNSAGSVLSGITIIASNSDYGIIVDSSSKVTIDKNVITGGKNCVLVRNSDNIALTNNNISKATSNGIQLKNVKNSVISKNIVSYNKRSGIETSNIYYCNITNNTVHHNNFNGISLFNISKGNIIKHNQAYENPNGIYIDSQSKNDVINANSFTYNRRDTSYELGAFESGNGLLFGADFRTAEEGDPSRLEVKYNVLAHNEGYQAKNNPELPTFKLGDNWFDSTDDENTFVCPMLLAGIMKMGTISVKNGIGLQMYDTSGQAVKEFGTFDTTVNINGNRYTAKFVNGKATIDATLDPDKEYDVEVMIGGKPVTYKYKAASGDEGDNKDSQTSQSTDGKTGAQGSSSQTSTSASTGVAKGNGENGTSNSAHYANSNKSGVYGTNASGSFKDSSDNGESALTNGNINAGDASEGEVSEEGKAYEIVPPSKISKEITDTSGLVVLSILSVMGMLIYGYWRREDFE